MKKPSTKKPVTPVTPAKSPAPATGKAAAPTPARIKKSAAPVATKPAAAPEPVKAAASEPAPKLAPPIPVDPVNPPVSAATPAAFTVVTAKVDVGFGNALYLRGEGPGLSWNKGLALKNAGSEEWTISLPRAARPIVFKFLLNDEVWSQGEDYKADPGTLAVLRPEF